MKSMTTSCEIFIFFFDYGIAVFILNKIPLFLRNSGKIWSHWRYSIFVVFINYPKW